MMNSTSTPGSGPSSDLRENIDETRQKMDGTIEELGERMNPKQIAEGVGSWWQELFSDDNIERFKNRGADAVEHVERHPLPYALLGLGLGIGAYATFKDHGRTRRQSRELQRQSEGAAESVKEASEEAYQSAKGASRRAARSVKRAEEKTAEAVEHGYERTVSAAEETSHRVASSARDAGAAFRRATDEQPLVVGAGLAAAGLIVGLLLPRSRPEDRAVGARAEDVKERAEEAAREIAHETKEAGKEALERGKEALHDTAAAARERASEKGLRPEDLGGEARSIVKEEEEKSSGSTQSDASSEGKS